VLDWLAALLLLTPLLTGALCALTRRGRQPAAINAVGALATLALGLSLAGPVLADGPRTGWGAVLYLDALGGLIVVIGCLVTTGAALYSVGYLPPMLKQAGLTADQAGWYYLWFHLCVASLLGVCLANNLGVMWVCLEATTVASALLVGFRQTEAALEAAWKYIILCTVGITFALFGLMLLYTAAGQALGPVESALDITELRPIADRLDPGLARLAFIFVLVGFGTKAGLAPLHTWKPDAYSQAPAPVGAVLAGAMSAAALYAILRVVTVVAPSTGQGFTGGLLLAFGLLSLAVATPFILIQRDLKRLLAYSSVEHIGLVAIAVGLGGPLALFGGLLHLLTHALAKMLLFFAAGNLRLRYGTGQMARLRGVARAMPLTGPALLVGLFAITGSPPLALFVSEYAIVAASLGQGQWWLGATILLAVGLIFAGMLHHIAGIALGNAPPRVATGERHGALTLLLGLPALALLALGLVVPPALSDALARVAAVLGGGP
jgi:hydrogenase-4 component F